MKSPALAVAAGLIIALAAVARAVPSGITYQGSLKEKGLPAAGTKTMLFRLTNADGSQVYWSSGNIAVTVNNGLFSARLAPAGVDWQNIAPYMEVSVEGQLLQPREPVAAAPYALMCDAVANEKGMIAMFETACPSGWGLYSKLQGRFPVGADGTANFTVGSTGGQLTHNHGGMTGPAPSSQYLDSDAGQHFGNLFQPHTHPIAPDSSLPPYRTVVFCEKQ